MNYDTQNCFSRLPCGLCRLTNSMCPFAEGSNFGQMTCITDGSEWVVQTFNEQGFKTIEVINEK